MLILGLNAFHADAAAAVIEDGRVLAACEEERFNRIKHSAGFPYLAIESCLKQANKAFSDVDHIAINSDPYAHNLKKAKYILSHRPNPKLVIQKISNRKRRQNYRDLLVEHFGPPKATALFHNVEHHKAHLGSAFFPSPFKESAIISIDGFGDFSSSSMGYGIDAKISIDSFIHFPHSLGVFYTTITQYLGFPEYGDEYKVMGMAPYGKPVYMDEMKKLVKIKKDGLFELDLAYFLHSKKRLSHQWLEGRPIVAPHFSQQLIDLLGPMRSPNDSLNERHFNIACSAQRMYEDALFAMLSTLHAKYRTSNLCIAGGCGANSVANGKICRNTPFTNIFVQPSPGDAGGALGAGLSIWHQLSGMRALPVLSTDLGPKFTSTEISSTVKDILTNTHILDSVQYVAEIGDETLPNLDSMIQYVASAISRGLVVGWFQGGMEWGPRALGNRSILGDPRRADMKDILNLKIKRRESFRPFAPSILREHVHDWFEIDADVPHMMQVLPIRHAKRHLIPAVTHVDGTGRLQTVTSQSNDRYHRLIKEFHRLTGIPMLLNTSFNENEPIVCNPTEAINCFSRTKMDVLVLEDMVISRSTR